MQRELTREEQIQIYAEAYARILIMYGVDVSDKLESAVQLSAALNQAYLRGRQDECNRGWIPCSERLPEEHDSMFKKFKGTNKWKSGMFESISNEVNVTIKFENGKTATTSGHTVEGRWTCEREYAFGTKVIAWQPLSEPYEEGE